MSGARRGTSAAPRARVEASSVSAAEGTLAAAEFIVATQALERLGIDAQAVLIRAGIPSDLLQEPYTRLPLRHEFRFWAAIEELSGDAQVGLRVGVEHARHGALTILEYLVLHSPTMRQALEAVQRIVPLVDDLGHVYVVEEGDGVRLGIRREGLPRAASYIEALTASVVTFYTEHVEGFHVLAVRFTQPRPARVRPYREIFGLLPEFGAPRNEIVFSKAFLDRQLKGGDPNVGSFLRDYAAHLLDTLPVGDTFITNVRRAMARQLESRSVTPDRVARALGVSPRTLRRRLSALGTSYQALLDELRHDIARHHLKHGQESIDAIAEKLGFASRSVFERAFRRHVGASPSAYRHATKR
jgi:AraC-like DNA-binding protein